MVVDVIVALIFVMKRRPPHSTRTYTRFPYTTPCRSPRVHPVEPKESQADEFHPADPQLARAALDAVYREPPFQGEPAHPDPRRRHVLDRKSTRLNSSH